MAAFHPKQTLKNAVLFGFCGIAELPVLPVGLRPCLRRDTGTLSKNLSAAEAGVSSLSAVAPSPLFRTRLPLSLRHCEHSRTFGRGTGFPRARARARDGQSTWQTFAPSRTGQRSRRSHRSSKSAHQCPSCPLAERANPIWGALGGPRRALSNINFVTFGESVARQERTDAGSADR